MTYLAAEAVQKLAEGEVIPKWHKTLREAAIAYLFKDGGMKHRGRTILAKIKKASPLEQHLTGFDLILIVNQEAWDKATERAKLALIDHELCHVVGLRNDAGDRDYRMRGHDLEEFEEILTRHGAWCDDIARFLKAQPDMFRKGDS